MSQQPRITDIFARATPIRFAMAGGKSEGSGFYYRSGDDYYLITNLHAIREEVGRDKVYANAKTLSEFAYPEEIRVFARRYRKNPSRTKPESVALFNDDGSKRWMTHPEHDADVVAIPIEIDIGSSTHNQAYSEDDFAPPDTVILGGDQVIAAGYPSGFYDPRTRFPVIRSGSIATPFEAKYRGLPCFLIDARMKRGSSGGPVHTQPAPVRRTDDGLAFMDGTVSYLIGVHSASGLSPEVKPDEEDELSRSDWERSGLSVVWSGKLIEEILAGSRVAQKS